jgi:molybdenum cofactor cytidylyltransferase
VSEIIVVGGNRADDVRAQIAGSGVKFALNELPNSEMSVSIARGVELASDDTDAFLIALCDQPAIPFSVVKDLIEYRERTGVLVIKPDYQGRGGHPILIGSEFRRKLVALDAGTSLRSFLGGMTNQTSRLRVDSPFVVRDMDTWQDYVSLHREVFGFSPLIPRPESGSGP